MKPIPGSYRQNNVKFVNSYKTINNVRAINDWGLANIKTTNNIIERDGGYFFHNEKRALFMSTVV